MEAANCTSVDAPHGVSEWALSGLTKRKSVYVVHNMPRMKADDRVVKPPHVAESAFSMECELVHWYEVKQDDGTLSNTVVFGRVRRFHTVCHSD